MTSFTTGPYVVASYPPTPRPAPILKFSVRLPPLSRFTTGWKLDEWQKRVLREVDKKHSAIVCAPTSSGKTIISTCVPAKMQNRPAAKENKTRGRTLWRAIFTFPGCQGASVVEVWRPL